MIILANCIWQLKNNKKEKHMKKKILILGIGNYLMGDEGVGVHVANQLSSEQFPAGVSVVDGGTGGFHLLEYFEQNDIVILIDATLDNHPAGTIRLIKPKFAADFPTAMSTHDIGLKDMVSALQLLDKMPDIHLFVISIASIQQQSIELTEEVQKASVEVMEKIKALVKLMG
jgi:hydrogenase maturation protease